MSYFLEAVQNNDSTLKFPENIAGKPIRELYRGMNKVNEQIQQLKIVNQQREQYFQTLLEHVATGIVTFNSNGFVLHANTPVKKMLGMKVITHISQIERIDRNLFQTIRNIRPFEQKLVTLTTEHDLVELSIKASSIKTTGEELILLSIQDIRNELDEKELDSWMKLIRVLMHEIMNSITPISSLASTANNILKNYSPEKLTNQESIDDVTEALTTIQRRSEGLTGFVNKFRDISKIPKPNFQSVKVSELFYRIRLLAEQTISDKNIELSFSINPEDLEIFIDQALIEQVLINLANNSIHALSSSQNGKIKFIAEINERGRAVLKVIDNGPGISEEILDRIFVPFFSTKKDGSGIGLSISQQIIHAHNGAISVSSIPNKETKFLIRL